MLAEHRLPTVEHGRDLAQVPTALVDDDGAAKVQRSIPPAWACAVTVASARPVSAGWRTGTKTRSAVASTRAALRVTSSGSPGPTPTPIRRMPPPAGARPAGTRPSAGAGRRRVPRRI